MKNGISPRHKRVRHRRLACCSQSPDPYCSRSAHPGSCILCPRSEGATMHQPSGNALGSCDHVYALALKGQNPVRRPPPWLRHSGWPETPPTLRSFARLTSAGPDDKTGPQTGHHRPLDFHCWICSCLYMFVFMQQMEPPRVPSAVKAWIALWFRSAHLRPGLPDPGVATTKTRTRLLVFLVASLTASGCHTGSKLPKYAEVPDLRTEAIAPPLNGATITVTTVRADANREKIVRAFQNNLGVANNVYTAGDILRDAQKFADLLFFGDHVSLRGLSPGRVRAIADELRAAGATVTVSP
jgi:hypothetical protein